MQKTLRFTKKPLDLSGDKDFGVTIVAVDNLRFFMRNFKNIIGHDDSTPYTGELWVKSVDNELKPTKLCECMNDGWGGTTDMTETSSMYLEIKQKVSQFQWKYGSKTKIYVTLDLIADMLACTCDYYKLEKTY